MHRMWANKAATTMLIKAKTLAILGTSSCVGKSLIATALCRIFKENGYKVAPFKAVNISLNSSVTKDKKEIALAQIIQAEAARIEPKSAMNPFLIKPQHEGAPQVIINGKVATPNQIKKFYESKVGMWSVIKRSLDQTHAGFDIVVIEGAASCAEPGFIECDIANLKIAKYSKSPIILVGDTERGGVFASLEGTISILRRHDLESASLIKGFLINKYKGRKKDLAKAVKELEKVTGIPVLGVIPYIKNHGIPEEDNWFPKEHRENKKAVLDIVVIRTPNLQNTQDFEPLIASPGVRVRFISKPQDFGNPDLVILGGSKNTKLDLQWLQKAGLAKLVLNHAQEEKALIGICGGFQMLGKWILDPKKVESSKVRVAGLGLLPTTTIFHTKKTTQQVKLTLKENEGMLKGAKGLEISGFEIHMGKTSPGAKIIQKEWVLGTYIHDIFNQDNIRRVILRNLAEKKGVTLPIFQKTDKDPYAFLANTVKKNINTKLLYRILNDQ